MPLAVLWEKDILESPLRITHESPGASGTILRQDSPRDTRDSDVDTLLVGSYVHGDRKPNETESGGSPL